MPAGSSAAAPMAPPDGAGPASYWGEIPPPDSRNTAAATDVHRPAWAHVLNAPYYVAAFPFRAAMAGVEVGVEHLGRSGVIRRLAHVFPLRVGGVRVTPVVSFGGGEGFGGGATAIVPRFLEDGNVLRLEGDFTTEGERKATLGVRWIHGPGTMVEVGAGYRSKPNTLFHGLGPRAPVDRESYFHLESAWGGVTVHNELGAGFSWHVGALYSGIGARGSSRSDRPYVSTEFAPELAAGGIFGWHDRSDGRSASLEVRHDDTEEAGRPESGGIRRAKITWFEGRGNSSAEFFAVRGEVQQFLPLWHTNRALAVRAVVAKIHDRSAEPVPFQRLLTNDDPDLFRGYPDFRFRDEGLAAASVEYRWPLWSLDSKRGIGADAYVFTDWGQVFHTFDEIGGDRLTTSYGFGVRAAGFGRFLGRIEVARSEEGTQLRIAAEQVFQYAKGGLYAGRTPIPER